MQTIPDRQYFEDYLYMRQEIDRLLSEDTTATDVVRGSSPEAPYTAHSIKVRGVDTQYAKWIDERVESLRVKCAEVEVAIANAPNSLVRLILMYRYMDGILNWQDLAEKLGNRKTAEACRKIHQRYFDGQ